MFKQRNIGISILVLLTVIPVVWWFFAMPIGLRFDSWGTSIGTLGKAAAIAGYVLFSLNFVLSLRTHWLERLFGPMDQVYRIHHITGGLAFIFLLFHPLFLAASIMPYSAMTAVNFLFSVGPWPAALGKASFVLLVLLILLTIYGYKKLGHDRWKITHKFLGLAFALGVLHAFYVPGELSTMKGLQYYLLGMGIIGLFAYAWRTLFSMYRTREYQYTVAAINDLGSSIYEVVLRPLQKKMKHMPGQFAFVRIIGGEYDKTSHPFTISSSPEEDTIRFSIKSLGDYTQMLEGVAVGTQCRVEGPFGRFTYSTTPEKNQVWIAGGIGVTPFLSMARYFRDQGSTLGYDIEMYYAGKTLEELVFLKELQTIASSLKKGFRIHAFDSSKEGYLTGETINGKVKDLDGRDVFVCGPMAMMDTLAGQFTSLGLPTSRIHKEDFALR